MRCLSFGRIGRIWRVADGRQVAGRRRGGGGGMATELSLMRLASAMDDADYLLVDGVVFATEYLRAPDEATSVDDVVIEAKHGDAEIMFTRGEIDGAEDLGEGLYRLKSGEELRFLSSATLH